MPISRIDVVSMPNRSQEASMFQHDVNERQLANTAQISNHFQKDVKDKMMKTIESQKTLNNEHKFDAKEKGSNQYFSSKINKKEKEKKKDIDKINTSIFDMKV